VIQRAEPNIDSWDGEPYKPQPSCWHQQIGLFEEVRIAHFFNISPAARWSGCRGG
jgi:hypothetical protein